MGHCFVHVRDADHAYGPGGMGERDGITVDSIVESYQRVTDTIDLPGFVLDNVTYESHRFWVHFVSYASVNPRVADRGDATVYVRIHHGGGWELWRADYMLAKALRRFGDDRQGMFLMLWFIWDAVREARSEGREQGSAEYRTAFVDGRLRKRRLPKQGKVKVWIEPKKEPAHANA